ncbi:MAG: serine hydrolase [Rickettsiaceae bacterium]|nr:serine hydrolase [Rickettsiaceae bacterium]
MQKIFLRISLLIYFVSYLNAYGDQQLQDDIRRFAQEYLDSRFVSCTYLFTEGNHAILKGAKGLFSMEQNEELKFDQEMPIASATKVMTASIILKLQARGKLNVKDTVAHHLNKKSGIWENNKVPQWAKEVTIHHLLTHTSGLVEYFMALDIDPGKTLKDITRDIANFAGKTPLAFTPGSNYEYCNTNFIFLGLIIEHITKKDLATVYEEEIFKPLGMKHTRLIPLQEAIASQIEDGNIVNHPIRYFATPTGFRPYLTVAKHGLKFLMVPFADGGVASNVEDLLIWQQALHSGKVLPKNLYKLMVRKHYEIPCQIIGKKHYTGYGIFMIEMDNGEFIYHHSGRAVAIRSESGYIPAKNLYFAVLSNVMEYIPTQLENFFNLEKPCNQLDIKYFLKYIIENLYNNQGT